MMRYQIHRKTGLGTKSLSAQKKIKAHIRLSTPDPSSDRIFRVIASNLTNFFSLLNKILMREAVLLSRW